MPRYVPQPPPYVPPPDWMPPPDYGAEGLPPDLAALLPPPVSPFHAEMPQIQPYQPPSAWQNALAALAGIQQPGYNRSGDWGPAIAGGFLRGLGGGALLRIQQREAMRQQANQAAQEQAAARNQANLEATKEAAKARGEYVGGLVKRAAGQIMVPWTKEYVDRSSALGQHVAGGGTKAQWDQRSGIRPAGGAYGSFGGQFDPDLVAEGMAVGDLAIDPSGYSRGQWGQIATSMRSKDFQARHPGFNQAQATADWKALNRYYSGLNTGVQLRLRQAIENAYSTADRVTELNAELSRLAPRSRITSLNDLLVKGVRGGLGSDQAVASAQKLTSFVNALQFELANVYMGGGVPTDQASKKAHDIINVGMSPGRLDAAIEAAKMELGIRRSAIGSAGVASPSNPTGTQFPDGFIPDGGR